jgi:hypothetical protein
MTPGAGRSHRRDGSRAAIRPARCSSAGGQGELDGGRVVEAMLASPGPRAHERTLELAAGRDGFVVDLATTWPGSMATSPSAPSGSSSSRTPPRAGPDPTARPTPRRSREKANTAKSMFMITPADMTRARAGSDFDSKSRGRRLRPPATSISLMVASSPVMSSTVSGPPSICSISSMPAIFTYPPSGRAEMTYSVSPRRNPITFGPKPMENRGTSMSTHFAVMKWPSSWTKMRTPRTTIVARIVVSMLSSGRWRRPGGHAGPHPARCRGCQPARTAGRPARGR